MSKRVNKSKDLKVFKSEIAKYQTLSTLGSGGNGIVYEVKETTTGETYALKTLHNTILNKINIKKNRKRVQRFFNEIKIVKEIQSDIPGILPINDIYSSSFNEIQKYNKTPFYTMPIAISSKEKLANLEIEEKIACVIELTSTLIELHKRKIAHRDIKPENIYFFEGKWCLSDFGLVKYPKRENLTQTREAVGPWTTMAPEMKRDAKNADPFSADIYSLAKTLWMILTEQYKSFDGQYNYENKYISLGNYYTNETHLSTLHNLLNKATSDNPIERPDAQEFLNDLKKWFDIKDDFEKRTKIEWEFILKELSPEEAESVVFRKKDSIVNVLTKVSRLKSFNHTFLPGGGGLDLNGCINSSQQGFIELDLDGITRIIKPKKLYLETFDDPQWNYFFLETEKIEATGIYKNCEERYDEFVLEISPGTYVEPYHINYGHYNGKTLSKEAREIILGLRGNYVIFPKHSFYNLRMDSYGAYQTQYSTPDEFKKFIEETQFAIKWVKENPQKAEKINKKRKIKKENEVKQWNLQNDQERKIAIEFIEEFDLQEYKCEEKEISDFKYFVEFDLGFEIDFFPTNLYKFKVKDENTDGLNFLDFISNRENTIEKYSDYLEFCSWESAKQFGENISLKFNEFIKDFKIIDRINFDIKFVRLKKPKYLFTLEEIKNLILNGDDKKHNTLVVENNGTVNLISLGDNIDINRFPVIGERFSSYSNTIGSEANYSEEEFEEIYLFLLEAWYRHLRDGGRKYSSDYCNYNIVEIIKKIEIEIIKYKE